MFQPGLFDAPTVSFDANYARLERTWLDAEAWVDFQRGWVSGSDALFETLRATRDWKQRKRMVWNEERTEPRLTAYWNRDSVGALEPVVIEQMRTSLSRRYGIDFDSVGFNLYRDGDDAVAWHRDAIHKDVVNPIVVLVSLGEPRKLGVRPFGGGASTGFSLGRGDLLVTGGTFQRAWEHTIARVKSAGPRISLAFRHGLRMTHY